MEQNRIKHFSLNLSLSYIEKDIVVSYQKTIFKLQLLYLWPKFVNCFQKYMTVEKSQVVSRKKGHFIQPSSGKGLEA